MELVIADWMYVFQWFVTFSFGGLLSTVFIVEKGGLEIVNMIPDQGPSTGEKKMIILMNGITKKGND